MFRPNGPIGRLLSWIMDQLTLNLLYMVSCLPVVTAGAATAALYSAQYALAEGRGGSVPAIFWQEFRRNFRQATLLYLLLLLLGLVLGGAVFSAAVLGLLGNAAVRVIAGAASAVYLGTVSWLFPLIARFEQKGTQQLYNAYAMSIGRFPLTAAMLIVNFWWLPTFLMLPEQSYGTYLFAVTFLQASLSSFLCSHIVLRWVK